MLSSPVAFGVAENEECSLRPLVVLLVDPV
jgi:hypothetical protein